MNTQPRDAITEFDEPLVTRLLRDYRMTKATVARLVPGVDYQTIKKALDPERFSSTRYETVIKVRRKTETLLRAAGWSGSSAELWRDFDKQLDQAA